MLIKALGCARVWAEVTLSYFPSRGSRVQRSSPTLSIPTNARCRSPRSSPSPAGWRVWLMAEAFMLLRRSLPNNKAIGEKFKDVGNLPRKYPYFILPSQAIGFIRSDDSASRKRDRPALLNREVRGSLPRGQEPGKTPKTQEAESELNRYRGCTDAIRCPRAHSRTASWRSWDRFSRNSPGSCWRRWWEG